MEVVIDSHALFWYSSDNKLLRRNLSSKTLQTLNRAKQIYVPIIVLLEVHYIFQKYLQQKKFPLLLRRIIGDASFVLVPLDVNVFHRTLTVKINEIHDRVIVATAKLLKKPLVSKDLKIKQVYPRTIW